MRTGLAGKAPTSHLYKNNRDGTFTDVTEALRVGRDRMADRRVRWATTTMTGGTTCSAAFWGHNILFHNNGNGTFTDVTRRAGLFQQEGCGGARAARSWTTTATGLLDLFICNYRPAGSRDRNPCGYDDTHFCQWKGVPIMCGPRGLPGDTNLLYHNNGDGTFTDVTQKEPAFSSRGRGTPSHRRVV